jgi:hypothetical protein
MQTFPRTLSTIVSAVATFYFARFFIGVALISVHHPRWISTVLSVLLSIGVARFVWTYIGSPLPGLARSVGIGALATGAIAFAAGFFGPLIFTPGANQGPLLGIFITGPLGLLLGAIGGALYWLIRRNRGESIADDNAA